MNPEGRSTIRSSTPDYTERKNFWLVGLVGEHYVDTSKICRNRSVTQMQVQKTFGNSLVGLLTLGIYSPVTAKVWCSK